MSSIGRQAGLIVTGLGLPAFLLVSLLAASSEAQNPEAQNPEIDHPRLWQAYAATFITPDGRVLDPQTGNRTTSEGQSYALFFALVNNDRPRFDKLLTWTTDNLATGDLTA